MNLYEFQSSCGELVVDENGLVNTEKSELDDWLLDIAKVDMIELSNYYKICGHKENIDLDGDVLDFGFWNKEGIYNPPPKSWRIDIFHNCDKSSIEQLKDIDIAEKWIKENR